MKPFIGIGILAVYLGFQVELHQPSEPKPLAVDLSQLDAQDRITLSKLILYGRFVSSQELSSDPLFQTAVPPRHDNPKRDEIYLLTMVRNEIDGPSTRIIQIQAALDFGINRKTRFSLLPQSLLDKGECWNLVQVVDHDTLLGPGEREKILRSNPEIAIRSATFK